VTIERPLVVAGLLVVLAGMALAACGSDKASGDWLARVQGPDGPVYLAAAGGGTLTRDGDCLYVVDGEVRDLLAFPQDPALASWDERAQVLTLRGHRYVLGAEMRFGGGELHSPPRSSWSHPPAPECDDSLVWLVGTAP
jgi:hypothetical protein